MTTVSLVLAASASLVTVPTALAARPVLPATAVGTPATADRSPTIDANVTASRSPLTWQRCDSSLPRTARCTTLTVPRDWGNDRVRGTYGISVARIPAEKPSQRIGVLTFNPGGPGSAAVSNITWVQGMLPQRVRDRFDIVAWDPRGVGGSEPSISGCTVKDIAPPKTGAVDWDAWTEKYVRVSGEAAAACFRANRKHAPYVGTWQLVHDLDALRASLGEETITFWGMSYGSTVGRAYAQYFPDRVRALVLDGVISPLSSIDLWAREHTWDDPLALDTMLDALGGSYRAKYDRVMSSLQTRTLRSSDGSRITRWTVGRDLIAWASFQTTWGSAASLLDQLSGALRTATRGRQARVSLADGPLATPKGWFDPQWTYVNCADMPDRPTAQRLAEIAREGAIAGGVHVGQSALREGAQCAGLPRFGRPLAQIVAPMSLRTPPLIANAFADNRTPWTAAQEMARAFTGSRTVQYGGTHHIVYGRTTGCVDRPITRYLLEGSIPASNVRCPLKF